MDLDLDNINNEQNNNNSNLRSSERKIYEKNKEINKDKKYILYIIHNNKKLNFLKINSLN